MTKAGNGKNKRLALVIDDSPLLRHGMRDLLAKIDFATEEVENGKQALEKIREFGTEHFNVITLDLIMPEMSGVEFMKVAREEFGNSLPPVIVCSSKSDMHLLKELLLAGIKGYIIKPFDEQMVVNKIKELFPDI